MKLFALLFFTLLHFSFAVPPPIGPYEDDPDDHRDVILALVQIPPGGPITPEQASAVQGNLTVLQKNLKAMISGTVKADPFSVKDSNTLEKDLEEIAPLGAKLLDDVAERKVAWTNAGILDYACEQVTLACNRFQTVLDDFGVKAKPAAARRAKKLKGPFVKKCTGTTKKLGCK